LLETGLSSHQDLPEIVYYAREKVIALKSTNKRELSTMSLSTSIS
jgi:hypothetical protein